MLLPIKVLVRLEIVIVKTLMNKLIVSQYLNIVYLLGYGPIC